MEVNKVKVKYGKDHYTGYYWVEPNKKKVNEIHISYEGVQKSQAIKEFNRDKQRRIAEEIFLKMLNDM